MKKQIKIKHNIRNLYNNTELSLVGTLDWKQFRMSLIEELVKAETEDGFLHIIKCLYLSMGTEKEIKKKRELIGISNKGLNFAKTKK